MGNHKRLVSLGSCFYSCTSLTSIPSGLFDNCPNVTSFSNCFYNCTSLASIPSGLFDNCPNVTNFGSLFYNCRSLPSIPSSLFDNCPNVTSLNGCFYGCISLTGLTPNTNGIELWQRAGSEGYPDSILGSFCFSNCNSLSNYSSIPSDWK